MVREYNPVQVFLGQKSALEIFLKLARDYIPVQVFVVRAIALLAKKILV